MNFTEKYRCPNCLELHGDEYHAKMCCADYDVVFICKKCESIHESEQDAENCFNLHKKYEIITNEQISQKLIESGQMHF